MTLQSLRISGRLAVAIVLIGALGSATMVFRSRREPVAGTAVAEVPALPEIAATEYRNTTKAATFVGRQTCAACHAEIDQAYQQTAHSRALQRVDVREEPPNGEFFDERSHRWYRVFRRDDELWHEESVHTSDGERLVLAAHPMQWTIGSGRFSRSYLAEIDGFLVESPVTWYRSRPGWDLSPGYDQHNSGFERPAELRCLFCHVGRAEPIAGSYQRIEILGGAIDCERCHGPGSLHVAVQGSGSEAADPDLTIVHPDRLDRRRSEAICAQCHLHSAAMVEIRGRSLQDFRPGLRLRDFAIPYGLESPSEQMQVVGHMEQMRLSRCWQESTSLTCITCHDPHHREPAGKKSAHGRSNCLQCHNIQACAIEEGDHRRREVEDNCVVCHMPESPTEIPHFAFTHHRIGIHTAQAGTEVDRGPQSLVPLADISHLSRLDQDRCLGLAYMQVADLPEHNHHAATYHHNARRILEDVRRRGLHDPAVDAALARLYWETDPRRTIELAGSVLSSVDATPDERATALFTSGATHFAEGRFDRAATLLEELVQIRRYSDAWAALSVSRQESGDLEGAVTAAHKAAEISPERVDFQQRLADLYHLAGRLELAERHRQRARRLNEVNSDASIPSANP
jgi:hypothetical protein